MIMKMSTLPLLIYILCGVWLVGKATAEEQAVELPKTKINQIDSAEMVLIPAGGFLMGTSNTELAEWLKIYPDDDSKSLYTTEMPQHKVDLDPYYMYKTEVTVAQYRKFCLATGHAMPPEPFWKWQEDHPIVNVTWEDANAYAKWAGASLPTEAQWEKAARGGDQRILCWGNGWPPPIRAGNFLDESSKASGMFNGMVFIDRYTDGYPYTSPVGRFTANPYGIYDLAGNVEEWCLDYYGKDYYKDAPIKNPNGPRKEDASILNFFVTINYGFRPLNYITRVLRGSSWEDGTPLNNRVAFRYCICHPATRDIYIGFRCVMN